MPDPHVLFQVNLESLQQHQLEAHKQVLRFLPPYVINTTQKDDGKTFIQLFQDDTLLHEAELLQESDTLVQSRLDQLNELNRKECDGVLLEGLYHRDELIALHNIGDSHSKGLVLIEPDTLRLIGVMMQYDFSTAFAAPWFVLATGDLNPAVLKEELIHRGFGAFAKWELVSAAPGIGTPNQTRNVMRLVMQLAPYTGKSEEKLKDPPEYKPVPVPKRILIIDCWEGRPGSYHLQAIEKAFESRGVSVLRHVVDRRGLIGMYNRPFDQYYKCSLIHVLTRFKPDWVLSIQHHSHEFLTEEFYAQVNIPWITILSTTYPNAAPYGRNEVTFVAEGSMVDVMRDRGAPYVHFLPLAADYYYRQPIPPELQTIPISFLGGCFYPTPEDFERMQGRLRPYTGLYHKIRDRAEDTIPSLSTFKLWDLEQDELFAGLPDDLRLDAAKFLDCWIGGARRLNAAEALKHLGIKVFGEEWKKAAPADFLDQCYGGALYGMNAEAELYRQSKINLNMMWQGNLSGPNMRFFNVPAVGGFQLTNVGPEFPEYFTPDQEIAIYTDNESLVEKAEYYLEHEDERREIADRARQRVLKEHLYQHRVDAILDYLKKNF